MAATTQMPMPGDPVTNERLETVLIGIATQIASGMQEVRTEFSALVNEAELRWQAKLDEQLGGAGGGGAGPAGVPFDPAALRAELAESQAATEQKLQAQNAELQQLQRGLSDLEASARRTEAQTTAQLEERTTVVLDTMTDHFDAVFDDVKTSVESLDWKVQGLTNQVWWMGQNIPTTVQELVAEIETKLQRQPQRDGSSHGGKKMRVRIPERTNLETFAGDRGKDKEGFRAWRDRLELHLDTVWPGLAEVFEKIRDAKEPLSPRQFSALVSEYGDKPHDTEDEDWEMRSVGRHLYKVLMDHTDLDAKKTVVGAPKRDGVEAYRLLTRQYDPFSYDVAAQMLENILVVGRANPKNIDQLDLVFKEL